MEERQTGAVSVFRWITLGRIGHVLCVILFMGILGIPVARTKPEAGPASKNQAGNVFRFDVFAPLGSLVPKPDEGGGAPFVFYFLYSYLFIVNENGQLEPDLATWWSYDKERSTWTIQIRQGAQFHDGSPVTASDVVYSLRTGIEMVLPSAKALLDRITAISEQIVEIHLKEDDPAFLEKICSFEILKQPKANNTDDSMHPIGSGPFKFEYRIGNEEIGLTANEHYYRGRPKVDRVVFYYQPDKEKSWTRLLAGKTDYAREIEPQDYQIIERYGNRFYFKTTVDLFFTALLYNTHDAYLSDPKVRKALSRAIDKQFIVRNILRGMGVVPSGSLGYYSSVGDSGPTPIPYAPQESIRLLREAGWRFDRQGLCLQKEGKPFELTILFSADNRLHESIARYVQLCFNDIGIKVHIQPLPFNEFGQRYLHKAENFQAVLTEFVDVRNAQYPVLENLTYLDKILASGGSLANPRLTAIINHIGHETNHSRRRALLDELDSLLESLQLATPLVQRTSLDVLSKRFVLPCKFSNMYYHFKLWQLSPVSR